MKKIIVSSHQPHFFPWLGYLDKMAKSDIFALNDIVQPIDKSCIVRNKILNSNGEPQYIGIAANNRGLQNISMRDYCISDFNATKNQVMGRIISAYHNSPYFIDIFPKIEDLFSKSYSKVIDLDMATISLLREFFEINTTIVYHSSLNLDNLTDNKSDNLVAKCKALKADIYLSGNGAKKYMEIEKFEASHIKVVYQDFNYPTYSQINSSEFVPNLSSLDILFNCGIEKAKDIFWNNVMNSKNINVRGI